MDMNTCVYNVYMGKLYVIAFEMKHTYHQSTDRKRTMQGMHVQQ